MAATASTPTRTSPPDSSGVGLRRRIAAIHLAGERGPLRFLALELAVWISLYGLYLAVRGLSIASGDDALGNARDIVDVERSLGVFHEARLQDALASFGDVLSVYYVLGFAPVLVGVLAWLALRHRDGYRELRSLLLISIALAVIVHVALPVAPPRLVPELGIVDTVGLDRDGSSFAGVPYNPYAAMPSMHVGWSLLVGLFALRASRSFMARAAFAAHPTVMAVAVTATGNHYFLDSVAGVLIALAALGLWRFAPRAGSRLATGPQAACAEC